MTQSFALCILYCKLQLVKTPAWRFPAQKYLQSQQFQESDENSGYRAPEVSMSGQYSLKSDVYSFGVVMLELMTGRKPFDRLFMIYQSALSLICSELPQKQSETPGCSNTHVASHLNSEPALAL